jgi:hypothetical protein
MDVSMPGRAGHRVMLGCVAIAFLLTFLILVPLAPAMPFAGIDGSWHYAMNVAVAEHMRFGKDLVFTFGPLAAIYTRAYHPATDTLMLVGSGILAVALFAGFFALTPPRRRGWLLLLPVVLAATWGRDATMFTLPLLLVMVACQGTRGGATWAALFLLAAASAILLLVKASFMLMVVVSTAAACLAWWRRSSFAVVAIPAIECIVVLAGWLAAGQSIHDLPGYFLAQRPGIAGYTDGMSTLGNMTDIQIFIPAACVLLLALFWEPRWRRLAGVPVVLLYIFIAFKSSFVRHDGHALFSAAALLLLGYMSFLVVHGWRRGLALAAGVVAWAGIAHGYLDTSPSAYASRLGAMVGGSASGAWSRLADPEGLEKRFHAGSRFIAGKYPLPAFSGTADLYPFNIAPLLASGSVWQPRPVFQSYAAYTTDLLAINAAHLSSAPPARIYFSINSIDTHYPSLDDGASWPGLLGDYVPRQLIGDYLVLDHSATAGKPALTPRSDRLAHLGVEYPVPGGLEPVWAQIEIHPTSWGRAVDALYKLPQLTLFVRYADKTTASFRLIAGNAKAGFLLSPTVATARDFLALQSRYSADYLAGRRVTSFALLGATGTRWLWQDTYQVSLGDLQVKPSVAADNAFLSQAYPGKPPASYDAGGTCNIEHLNERKVTPAAMEVGTKLISVRGWAALDPARGKRNDEVRLLVTGQDAQSIEVTTVRTNRPDVAAYFHENDLNQVGFEALLDASRLPADAQIRVLQIEGDTTLACTPAILTLHRRASN